MYPDLDEVADGLLSLLGIAGTVCEPCLPVGGSGTVSMQRYDIPESLRRLNEILGRHHYEMRALQADEAGFTNYMLWVKPRPTGPNG